jgi:hypothetical protein
MTGEFTAYCNHYYELTKLLSAREERFKNLLNNAPLYCGQTSLSEADAIISYYRKVQTAKAQMDNTFDDLTETGRLILMIMRYFEMPPGTVLTGEIPGELAYELWANENDALHISKTINLQPKPDNPNIIVIKFANKDDGEEEE